MAGEPGEAPPPEAPKIEFSRVDPDHPAMGAHGTGNFIKDFFKLLLWRHGKDATMKDVIEASAKPGEHVTKP